MIPTSSLLTKYSMLSVNQLNAQIKLVEIWKALNVDDYPLTVVKQTIDNSRVNTRADTKEKPIEIGKSLLVQKTCISDAFHLWNNAPEKIINSITLTQEKLK
jgi:hypothetical protein